MQKMVANKKITGENIKLMRPAYKMYLDSCCDNSVRFCERLNCSLRCQLSNTDHGLPGFLKKKNLKIYIFNLKKNDFKAT